MHAIESLVPGFERALERTPGASPAWRALERSIEEDALPDRTSALVSLAVAEHAGGEYSRWVAARLAAKQGISAEDIFLATAGTARNPRDALMVSAAGTIASKACFHDTAAFRELSEVLGSDSAPRVLAHVALALLACDVLDSVAPGRQATSSSRRGTWQ
jgi:alkylhydroperoxidase/carboxymuconolactone decarboxylase family protein YurZ